MSQAFQKVENNACSIVFQKKAECFPSHATFQYARSNVYYDDEVHQVKNKEFQEVKKKLEVNPTLHKNC